MEKAIEMETMDIKNCNKNINTNDNINDIIWNC